MSIPEALKQRLATAAILIPVIVSAVLFLPTSYFAVLMGAVVCIGAWEWARFVGLHAWRGRAAYVTLVALCMLLQWQFAPRGWAPYLLGFAVFWWAAVVLALAQVRRVEAKSGLAPALIAVGLIVLVIPWVALVALHGVAELGPSLVLALMVLIWIADSAAYFAGRRWGTRKLAQAVSPGKTWAGVYGGVVAAALWGAVLVAALGLPPGKSLFLLLLCAMTAVLSVAGDLFESLLKRQRGLKDAGSLLPGHGGVLDRIDSMTAAAPLFAIGLLWLENAL